jgi:MOSC domain-containing protein YiiM
MSKIINICVSEKASQPMVLKDQAELLKDQGIKGDRYFLGVGTWSDKDKPHQQITLIESENIDYINSHFENKFSYQDFRRNIITKNIQLNNLVGKNIIIGSAELEVIKLRHPCLYLAKLLGHDTNLVKLLRLRGGIACRVIKSGGVKINDKIIS